MDLTSNNLTTLPDSIGSLVNLQELNLWGNKLTTLFNEQCELNTLPDTFYKISSHCYIKTDSKALLSNLPNNLEYVCFEDLDLPLTNLPYLLIELKLKSCNIENLKLPYGCKLIYT